MIVRVLLAMAVLAGTAITVAGLLAPVYPAVDSVNNFRPFILAGAGALLAAAAALRVRRLVWAGAALAGLNAVLFGLPLVWSAAPAERPAVAQAHAGSGKRDIKIVTFNMAFGDAKAVARFILQEDPDIVVLQEAGAAQANALRAALNQRYPHSRACSAQRRCAAAIFAKRAWTAAGHDYWTGAAPEMIWAQFDDPELGRLRVVGVHLHLPFRAEQQTRQIDRLIAERAAFAGPALIAGDFNMTPWSYRLQRLLASADLRRHATFLRSWPTDSYPQLRLPAPAFLIDHVLGTPDITSVSIRTGPNLGSDHLPVVATVRLPES
jgi:endonuclease/exonuclease/phosphatase (EEP) superfamily protein YafD